MAQTLGALVQLTRGALGEIGEQQSSLLEIPAPSIVLVYFRNIYFISKLISRVISFSLFP
jgi:hypothetical protein